MATPIMEKPPQKGEGSGELPAGIDPKTQTKVNNMGPGGTVADPNVDTVESGQPAGGPHDLGAKAAAKKAD